MKIKRKCLLWLAICTVLSCNKKIHVSQVESKSTKDNFAVESFCKKMFEQEVLQISSITLSRLSSENICKTFLIGGADFLTDKIFNAEKLKSLESLDTYFSTEYHLTDESLGGYTLNETGKLWKKIFEIYHELGHDLSSDQANVRTVSGNIRISLANYEAFKKVLFSKEALRSKLSQNTNSFYTLKSVIYEMGANQKIYLFAFAGVHPNLSVLNEKDYVKTFHDSCRDTSDYTGDSLLISFPVSFDTLNSSFVTYNMGFHLDLMKEEIVSSRINWNQVANEIFILEKGLKQDQSINFSTWLKYTVSMNALKKMSQVFGEQFSNSGAGLSVNKDNQEHSYHKNNVLQSLDSLPSPKLSLSWLKDRSQKMQLKEVVKMSKILEENTKECFEKNIVFGSGFGETIPTKTNLTKVFLLGHIPFSIMQMFLNVDKELLVAKFMVYQKEEELQKLRLWLSFIVQSSMNMKGSVLGDGRN